MKNIVLLAVICCTLACGYPQAGSNCPSIGMDENGTYFCVDQNNPEQFWIGDVPVGNEADFYSCDCSNSKPVRRVISNGQPISSNPSQNECYAISVSAFQDSQCSTGSSPGALANYCLRAVNMGGMIACSNQFPR